MQFFTLQQRADGWHISDGRVDFGPYSTREKASDSAAELSRQRQRRMDLVARASAEVREMAQSAA